MGIIIAYNGFEMTRREEKRLANRFAREVVWEGASIAWDTDYKVVATKPHSKI